MKKFEQKSKSFLLKLLLLFSKNHNVGNQIKLNRDSKILLIRLNRIGDALVTTPLIKQLKESTGCKIHILASKKNFFIFNNNIYVDRLFIYPKSIRDSFHLIAKLGKENYDAVIDTHEDLSTTVSYIIALIKAKNKIGIAKGNKKIYTTTIEKLDGSKNHIVVRINQLLRAFSIPNSDARINYFVKQENEINTKKYLNSIFKEINFLIVVNISAGSDARFWGVDNFKRLIKLLKNYSQNILITSSPDDKNIADEISEGKISVYSPNFDNLAAVIKEADLLVSPDTAAVHLAAAFNVPVFGLYVNYETEDVIWTPYKTDCENVITTLPTLKSISFDEVEKKIIPFLEKKIHEKQST